jgi:hypothetical protein
LRPIWLPPKRMTEAGMRASHRPVARRRIGGREAVAALVAQAAAGAFLLGAAAGRLFRRLLIRTDGCRRAAIRSLSETDHRLLPMEELHYSSSQLVNPLQLLIYKTSSFGRTNWPRRESALV